MSLRKMKEVMKQRKQREMRGKDVDIIYLSGLLQ